MESNVNAESTERKIHGLARHLRLSEAWNVAVSYTHLDVYKRQVNACRVRMLKKHSTMFIQEACVGV